MVFSKALNENLHVAALEGAFASVIGGASVERARRVESIDDIINLPELRPYIVRKVGEGMKKVSPSRKR